MSVNGEITGAIGAGLCVLLGVAQTDTAADAHWLANKVMNLRVFADRGGKMNRSLLDVDGELLVVSQFTLYAEVASGNRPSYSAAARAALAAELYESFIAICRAKSKRVATGVFRAHMQVSLVNDGPVTMLCDSAR